MRGLVLWSNGKRVWGVGGKDGERTFQYNTANCRATGMIDPFDQCCPIKREKEKGKNPTG